MSIMDMVIIATPASLTALAKKHKPLGNRDDIFQTERDKEGNVVYVKPIEFNPYWRQQTHEGDMSVIRMPARIYKKLMSKPLPTRFEILIAGDIGEEVEEMLQKSQTKFMKLEKTKPGRRVVISTMPANRERRIAERRAEFLLGKKTPEGYRAVEDKRLGEDGNDIDKRIAPTMAKCQKYRDKARLRYKVRDEDGKERIVTRKTIARH